MEKWSRWFRIGVSLLGITCAPALEIKVPGVEEPILVDLPANHEDGMSWPAVFSYHGQNGQPNTARTREHTGAEDWIVVGMAYAQRGEHKLSQEALDRELAVLRAVRDRLQRSHGLDPKRLHLVGYSKGGWMVDSLLQVDRTLAGGAMLMAGHLTDFPKNPKRFNTPTPVFIGVGREDPNHFYSLKALLFYRTLGAKVDMEVWPELGHAFPSDGSVGLKEWFALRNGKQPDQETLQKEFEALTNLPAEESWATLSAFRERPFTTVPGSPWPERIKATIEELEKNPAVAKQARLARAHRSLLARELKARTAQDFLSLDSGYMKLLAEASGTDVEELAQRDHRRVLTIVEQIRKQAPAPQPKPAQPIQPDMPTNDRVIPRNPMVR
ncbi:alpha/beta hydrolase [Haloferula rosea]|uniref:Dienelactone hydrolase domain-containing protein n=1 Tax=Haloferula rosea TaxID=490093 RepID=A0A934RAH6_9BACT|nr:hypothetical protein [Haloferula rosea]MBK1825401.1 hypothetical protein [Haloferula rosea]